MSYKVISGPITEPVTVEEARSYLRLGSDTSHDNELELMIQSAREGIERELNRVMVTQVIEDQFPCIPESGVFTLRFSPVTAIVSFRWYDMEEAVSDISDYVKDIISEPATVRLTDDFEWPDDVLAVKIRYSVGYPSAISTPARLREAILLNVSQSFECRLNGKAEPGLTLSDKLISTYRVYHPDINV